MQKMKLVPGLVSVTFRKRSAAEIIQLATDAELFAVEWGGDVHVPAGDLATAAAVRRMCESAGINCYAYGSYYRAGVASTQTSSSSSAGKPVSNDFQAVLDTAVALGAPAIRIWAGDCGSAECDSDRRTAIIDDIRHVTELAGKAGLTVDLEYHANTLTDRLTSAADVLDKVTSAHLRTYWQPRNGAEVEENLTDLRQLLPRIANVHVFHWWPDSGSRLALAEGRERWSNYLRVLSGEGCFETGQRVVALEFVPNDDPAALLRDAVTLRELISHASDEI